MASETPAGPDGDGPPPVTSFEVPRTVEPPDREKHRSRLAMVLLILFAIQVLVPIGVVIFDPDRTDAVLSVVNVVITPTVAILGAVVGFYFGTKPRP